MRANSTAASLQRDVIIVPPDVDEVRVHRNQRDWRTHVLRVHEMQVRRLAQAKVLIGLEAARKRAAVVVDVVLDREVHAREGAVALRTSPGAETKQFPRRERGRRRNPYSPSTPPLNDGRCKVAALM